MTAIPHPFTRALDETAARLEPVLDALLGGDAIDGEIVRPARLVAAMRHALLGGGKRFRPFLVVEAARLFDANVDPWPTAAAVEILHSYSLVHDDLPAMDDDALRRGRPTVHVAFDEATAILAGDALLALAFDVLARPATHPDPAVRSDLVLALARAGGVGGMAGGQYLDLEAEQSAVRMDEAAVRRMQAMKTGRLIRAAIDMGARLGGADAAARDALARYGDALGLAFQIGDDLLDVESDAATLGKAVAKDAEAGKATLVGLIGSEGARRVLADTVAVAKGALGPFGDRAGRLLDAARFMATRRA